MKVKVRVVPNAKQNKIVEEKDRLKVYLNAPPVEGKANKALVELLAEHYNVRRSKITILKGQKGREKVVEINA